MSEDTGPVRPQGEIVIYQPQQGNEQIRVLLEGETVWLTQRLIAELFGVSVKTVNEHLINIYDEGELDTGSTIRKFRIVQTEGKRRVTRLLDHYSLDAILAVGYRTRSPVGTAFRQWATARLSEYLVKGFTLNDDRLKGTDSVTDYFDELLARIREIRASEARVYQEGEEEKQGFFATARTKSNTPPQAWRRLRRSSDVAPTRASPTWAQRRGKAAAFSSAISARPRTISTIRKSTPSTASPSCSPTRPSSAPSGGGWRRKPRPRPSTSRTCGRLRRCWRRGVRNRKRRRRGRESQDGSNAGRAANERLGSHRHRLRLYRRARPGPKLASWPRGIEGHGRGQRTDQAAGGTSRPADTDRAVTRARKVDAVTPSSSACRTAADERQQLAVVRRQHRPGHCPQRDDHAGRQAAARTRRRTAW